MSKPCASGKLRRVRSLSSVSYGSTVDMDETGSPPATVPQLPHEVWHVIFEQLAQIMNVSDLYRLRVVNRMFNELACTKSFRVLRAYFRRDPADKMTYLSSDLHMDWLPLAAPFPDTARFIYGIHCYILPSAIPPTPNTISLPTPESSPPSSIPPGPTLSALHRIKISYSPRGFFYPMRPKTALPIEFFLLPQLFTLLLAANTHLKSVTLHNLPSHLPNDHTPTLRALAPGFARVEYLSLHFEHVMDPAAIRTCPTPPVPEVGGVLSDDEAFLAPWQLSLAYLARDNLRALDLRLTEPSISWPYAGRWEDGEPREFGPVFPRLETLLIRDYSVDAKTWADFLVAHRQTVKWVGFKGVLNRRHDYLWSTSFVKALEDGGLDLEVLELRQLQSRRTEGQEKREDDTVLAECVAGIEKGRNGFRRRTDGLGFAEAVGLGRAWFEWRDIRAAWDPVGDILKGRLSDAESLLRH